MFAEANATTNLIYSRLNINDRPEQIKKNTATGIAPIAKKINPIINGTKNILFVESNNT